MFTLLLPRLAYGGLLTLIFIATAAPACAAITAEQRGNDIRFDNGLIAVTIQASEGGFALAAIERGRDDQSFLTTPSADLFEIRMTLDPKFIDRDDRGTSHAGHTAMMESMAGDHFTVTSRDARITSWRVDHRDGESSLHLHWQGFDLREQNGAMHVQVTVTLRDGDPMSYWRINVDNNSGRYGIERVRFPIISLCPIDDAAENVYVYPKWRGGLSFDPFNAPPGLGQNLHDEAGFYPLTLNMQFQALYNQRTHAGLYMATHDPAPTMKLFQVINTPDRITWKPNHFPPNITFAGENFEMQYDCVVGPYDGDWYDACAIYRRWAIAQSWCARGPLMTREDVPTWYKHTPVMLYTHTADSAAGTHSAAKNHAIGVEHVREMLDWLGTRVPVLWFSWEKYHEGLTNLHTPFNRRRMSTTGRWAGLYNHNCFDGNYPKISALDDFPAANASLRAQGAMVVPYVCLQMFDQGPEENAPFAAEAKPHMSHDLYGALLTYRGYHSWLPCASTQWWRDRMVDTCVTLLERENVGGFYLDVMHGMCHPCYWTPHGHSAAGGDSMTSGMHGLVQAVHDAVKAKDPEVIIVGENATENMIDVIDGVMSQRTLRDETRAPLFATVYQDYVLRFGRDISVGNPDYVIVETASLFVEGAQIGPIRLRPRSGNLSLDNENMRELVRVVEQIAGYYAQPDARQFLSYGQLMHPLLFDAPSSMPTVAYNPFDPPMPEPIAFPALFSGVFRSPSGDLGVFVVNASGDDIAFESRIDLSQYGMDGSVDVDAIASDGSTRDVMVDAQDTVTLSDTLAGRDITMYLLRGDQ
jgi:hypothetical protein